MPPNRMVGGISIFMISSRPGWRTRSRGAHGWCAEWTGLTRITGSFGLRPPASFRAKIPITCTTTASTSTVSGLTALDEGNGTHTLAYSPDRKYLIDTYSRLDLPPVNNLRRVSDGKMVCALETADITELQATGWKPMETFAAKGRDGVTDIYGVIERPRNLDPSRKYPIIEDIYAGPQGTPGTTAPTAFTSRDSHAAYTANGFIVVKIDAMGTANRSKAFQDVCWRNLADAGFPDRILWIKAAAAQYSYMDTNRVGIFGTSAGGQSAAGAVIFHPEFYKAAAANSGCHDNRIDKSTWNEQWMGYLPHDQIWRRDPDNLVLAFFQY